MSETAVAPNERATEIKESEQIGNFFFNGGEPVVVKPETTPAAQEPTPAAAEPAPTTEQQKVDEEVLDAVEYLKREYGWESPEAGKAEIEELRKLKETKPQDLKFENEESKRMFELLRQGKVDDVLETYNKQKMISNALSLEVNDTNAADIIKLSMQLKYPTLTKDQIDFQFKQDYGIPREPVQKDGELEEDFQERHTAWQEQVSNIKMKASIAATMAKPELEQLKTKIVYPEIQSQQEPQAPQLSQEELDKIKRANDSFIQSVENSAKSFNGVSVTVKNDIGEFPVNYGTTDADKASLVQTFKDFVGSNYDANTLLAELWVNEDGTLKTEKMIKDYHFLLNADKIIQKIANESAAQAIATYVKGKKNISISDTTSSNADTLGADTKTEMDKVRDFIFNQ